jgi:hypothetical protein
MRTAVSNSSAQIGHDANPARPQVAASHATHRVKALHVIQLPRLEAASEPGMRNLHGGFLPRHIAFDFFSATPVLYESSAIPSIASVSFPNLLSAPKFLLNDPLPGDDRGDAARRFFPQSEIASAFPLDVRLVSLEVPRFASESLKFEIPRTPLWFRTPSAQIKLVPSIGDDPQ